MDSLDKYKDYIFKTRGYTYGSTARMLGVTEEYLKSMLLGNRILTKRLKKQLDLLIQGKRDLARRSR